MIKTGVNIIILLLKVNPKKKIKTDAYRNYYKINIGSVEILRNNEIENHLF